MPRNDLPKETWVVQPFKSHESKAAGFSFGRVKLEGDNAVKRRYRRKLERRIRSINERRLEALAASMPNRELEAENDILRARLEVLEAALRQQKGQ